MERRADDSRPWPAELAGYLDDAVDVVDAENLTPERFHAQYWSCNRPCLIKNAVRHWPAATRWGDRSYLEKACGNPTIVVRRKPEFEVEPTASPPRGIDGTVAEPEAVDVMKWSAFLDEAMEPGASLWTPPFTIAESEETANRINQRRRKLSHERQRHVPYQRHFDLSDVCWVPFQGMKGDLGDFRFLPNPRKARAYPRWRVFAYRNSFTDWHYHPTDAHLMCQVVGTKEVALVPPTREQDPIFDAMRDAGHSYEADRSRHSGFFALRPLRVLVADGDALYIPIYWWHAVQDAEDRFGITVAATWAAPMRVNLDRAFFATRENARLARAPVRVLMRFGDAGVRGYRAWKGLRGPRGWEYRHWDWPNTP